MAMKRSSPRDAAPHEEAMRRGDWGEAMAILEQARSERGLSPQEALAFAHLLASRGEIHRAEALLEPLRADARAEVAVEALLQDAVLALGAAPPRLDHVEALVAQAAERAGDDARLRGLVAHCRSRVLWRKGEIEAAGACLQESRALLEAAGDEEQLARVFDSLALLHDHHDAYEDALSYYLRSISMKARWQDLHGIAITLGNLGRLHLKMCRPRVALACLEDDLKIAEQLGDLRAQATVRINIGQALMDLDRVDEAITQLNEAQACASTHGWLEQKVYALKDLAWALASKGMGERACELVAQAEAHVREGAGSPYVHAQVLLTKGRVLLHVGKADDAESAFHEARKLFATLGATGEEALAFHGLAEAAGTRHDWQASRRYMEAGVARAANPYSSTALLFEGVMAKLQAVAQDRPIPERIGPYRIICRLGAGTFGEVYKAFDALMRTSNGEVAIKCLRKDEGCDDDGAVRDRVARFQRECEVLARIEHPNVVRLIDVGEDRAPYLVMEFLAGGDLRKFIKLGEPLAVPDVLRIAGGVLDGLCALHAAQAVHRDLKPANILLRDGGEPVIADFGLVRVLDITTITLHSTVLGTIAYMAPEQLRGEPVDGRADIYSVGCILFQLLTGRILFEGDTPGEVLRQICEQPAPRVTELRPTLPEKVAGFIERCLMKDPGDRYSSACEALAALRELRV